MRERILELAMAASGQSGEEARALLEPLCAAAEEAWRRRLRKNVAPEDCGEALLCAAAFTAAAGLTAEGGAVASFSAGDISVRAVGGGERMQLAGNLRREAERLMQPYVQDPALWVKGVRG